MTYSHKVKAGRVIVERMDSLNQDEKFTFKYRKEVYQLTCYSVYDNGERNLAIGKVGVMSFGSMNIGKIGPTTIELYTYDLMNQRSTYKMDMSSMEVLTPKEA